MDLFVISALGNCTLISQVIQRNREYIFKINRAGWSPLMYACFYSHKDVVYLLMSAAPDCIYITNRRNQTALMLATFSGNTDVVNLVLKDDILEWTDNNGWNALFYAVYYGQETIIKLLLSHKMDINFRDKKGRTVVIIAASLGMLNIIGLLLSFGADCTVTSNCGKKALHYALQNKYYEIAELLNISSVTNLECLLSSLSLRKYIPILKYNNIDLENFLRMNEDDLKEIGIGLLGPRRKMVVVINKFNHFRELYDIKF